MYTQSQASIKQASSEIEQTGLCLTWLYKSQGRFSHDEARTAAFSPEIQVLNSDFFLNLGHYTYQ